MFSKILFIVLFCCAGVQAQQSNHPSRFTLGLAYGNGREFSNNDYSYSNSYIQGQLYYSLNPGKKWEYQLAIQPEVNFVRHRLKNYYFIKPDEPNFASRRDAYIKLKDVREYIFGVSFFVRHNFTDSFSLYAMGNVGPMITDTDTERLTKGFAFCDVFALGASYNFGGVAIDVRPNLRHVSNAGLQDSNAGFNTRNIAFGITVPIR